MFMATMTYTTRTTCRLCSGDKLRSVLHLGDLFVSDFVPKNFEGGIRAPLELVVCENQACGLLQLRDTAPQEIMYARHYWYRSGLNQVIIDDLRDIAEKSQKMAALKDGDVVLEPWAVESLRTCIQAHPWAYMAWGQLWEDYGDRLAAGGAVRIWRRWPLRLFRFRDERCVDRDLHSRIRLTGMRRVQAPADRRFGTHLPRQTPFARFSKAKGDCAKWLTLGRYDLIAASLERSIESQDLLKGILAAMRLSSGELHRSKNAQEDWLEYLKSESSSCGVLPMWMRTTD